MKRLFIAGVFVVMLCIGVQRTNAQIAYTLTTVEDPVIPGQTVEFDLTATNLGGTAALANVDFTVPQYTTYEGAGKGTVEYAVETNLAAGASIVTPIYLQVVSGNGAPPDGTAITLNVLSEYTAATASRSVI